MNPILACLTTTMLLCSDVQAISIVVPSGNTDVEGNHHNTYPFGFLGVPTRRYQQVYEASEFTSASSGGLITQLQFRADARNGDFFNETIPNIQIDLSTTAASPDALSLTFADNVGADSTTVHSGPLALSTAESGNFEGPKEFDIVINLQSPFHYDPSQGNLLLDVRNFDSLITTAFDAHLESGDSVSRIWSSDVNSLTADPNYINLAPSLGLVTKFTIMVPEPASLALLAMSSIAITSRLRRRSHVH